MDFFALDHRARIAARDSLDFLQARESALGEAPVCPECNRYTDMMTLVAPVRLEMEMRGEAWLDLATGPANQILVSRRLLDFMMHRSMTGVHDCLDVSFERIQCKPAQATAIPKYVICSVTTSRAAVDFERSSIDRQSGEACRECRLGPTIDYVGSFELEASTWSGEDLFYARGLPGTLIATERFLEASRGLFLLPPFVGIAEYQGWGIPRHHVH